MKKTISVMVAVITAVLSVFCVSASAFDFPETDGQKEDTANTYYFKGISLIDSEERYYLFDVEKVILPQGYKPLVKVCYDGKHEFELPGYITLVFTDGSSVKCSPDNPPTLKDGKELLIRYITTFACEDEYIYGIEIYRWFSETSTIDSGGYYPHNYVVVNCEETNRSLKENIMQYKFKIRSLFSGYIKNKIFNLENPFYAGGIIYTLPDLFRDIFEETALFLNYFTDDVLKL